MSESGLVSPLPLFDRLCAEAEGEGVLDARALQASIAGELSNLLNTRSRLGAAAFLNSELSVVDFGMPDITALSPQSRDDRQLLQQLVRRAIACFEPRLSRTQVQVLEWPGDPKRAKVEIMAVVRLGKELRRVKFELAASSGAIT